MGNSSSIESNKSNYQNSNDFRKSSASKSHNQNLNDEFSDLILHKVKKDENDKINLFGNDETDNVYGNDETDKINLFGNFSNDPNNELNDLITDDSNINDLDIDNIGMSMESDSDLDMDIVDINQVDFRKLGKQVESRDWVDNGLIEVDGDVEKGVDTELEGMASGLGSNTEFDSERGLLGFHHGSEDSKPQELESSAFQQESKSQEYWGSKPSPGDSSFQNPAHHDVGNINKVSSKIYQQKSNLIPIEIKWMNNTKELITKISIIGSFSNWKEIIPLKLLKFNSNEFSTTINLPIGVHKLLYMINNEYRVSELLPTATDQEGVFFNWFEVIDESRLFNHPANQPDSEGYDANIILDSPAHPFNNQNNTAGKRQINEINEKSNSFLTKISKESSNFEHIEYSDDNNNNNNPNISDYNSNSRIIYKSGLNSSTNSFNHIPEKLQYSNEIPEMFVNYDYFENKSPNYELPEPHQLPAHLNNVLLNKISNSNQNTNSKTTLPNLSSKDGPKRPALRRADSSYYASNKQSYHSAIPNHVILNHLMTTSIRNDVLTVACITRYSGKFITQIVHSPANTGKQD